MKTKNIGSMIAFALTAVILIGCDQEKVLTASEIPSEITEYVSTHFPNNNLLQAVEDRDGFTRTYDVVLSDNITLEFNRKKEITDIDGNAQLPDSVIPTEISLYVATNFPNNVITDWELEDRHQQVGLDNGADLEFTMNGDFIRIDN
ncbi:MAG: PepSY-like domain-containing protein [Proteiniphilum sp.]